jgi:hypothetical protein
MNDDEMLIAAMGLFPGDVMEVGLRWCLVLSVCVEKERIHAIILDDVVKHRHYFVYSICHIRRYNT